MDKSYEALYHEAEDTNWWFISRRDFILQTLKKYGVPKDATVLDIGCGGGGLVHFLATQGYRHTAGIDSSPEAVSFCEKRGLTTIHLDDAKNITSFPERSFDSIISSDVLEHLNDPKKALTSWFHVLKEGGLLILFVPAFTALWSERDVLNHHIRRYTGPEIIRLGAEAGFTNIRHSYWNFMNFIPYFLILKLKSHTKNKIVPITKKDTFTNKLLKAMLYLENRMILAGFRFPFGVSFVVVFKKSEL